MMGVRASRPRPFRRWAIFVLTAIASLAAAASAQEFFGGEGGHEPEVHNIPYDGRFTFARARYATGPGGWYYRGLPAWAHGYPNAEQNLMKIMNELSNFRPHITEDNVYALDDPELYRYPIVYMTEAGYWSMTDENAKGLRDYLLKGGFAIFEDFDGAAQWANFEAQMRRVLPDGRFVRLDRSNRIFGSFFEIKDIDAIVHPMSRIRPSYYGIFEGNDPSKRLMVIANFDNDVPEYWEWSGQGLFPFDASNEAYKLGVNYLIYGMTH